MRPNDLRGYKQCHFFAGIGGWSCAFRRAGFPDYANGWTASLPCQPFSVAAVAAGLGKGTADPRHLLPVFLDLVAQCRPPVIYGEQVASALKWGWLDQAFGRLENYNYACAAAVIPALAVGAAHERKRLYWVADARSSGRTGYKQEWRLPSGALTSQPVHGNPLADARRAMDGDLSHLLPCDGLSVVLERQAVKGYGNAIVVDAAVEFVCATEGW